MLSFSWAILKSLIRIVPDERDVAFKTQSALYKPEKEKASKKRVISRYSKLQLLPIDANRDLDRIEHQPDSRFQKCRTLAICNVEPKTNQPAVQDSLARDDALFVLPINSSRKYYLD